MKRINKLKNPIAFASWASVGGYEEMRGPLGEKFDLCDGSDLFGKKTWELAEGEMCRLALNTALSKLGVSHSTLELLVAGDLQNQCVATSLSLGSFGIPFLGVYGACSTCAESLAVLAAMMDSTDGINRAAALTSSHNAAAERQFRSPLEYGGQRSPTAQWTSTAAAAFILEKRNTGPKIEEWMIGRTVDSGITDGSNMGAAMSFAAADSIISYFEESGRDPDSAELIVTGDLGRVGSDILKDILSQKLPGVQKKHVDCGMLLYDGGVQDMHSGASGCGTSAAVLAAHFLPKLAAGEIKEMLFLATGALMNPQSLLQGQPIAGIAPLVKICAE